MNKQGKILKEILENMTVDLPDDKILNELLYTAYETGILYESSTKENAILIFKIIELSKVFKNKLPKELRM